ncbi:hypothetical protein U9M48_018767 [Paspalum notatum var. saurae]|uniref:RNase H type-1 domain-containing protein n=1 Tax=Paspalum notatum var. saurae TaxID=547442 RepID=A0AAQ3TE74_PASNO
MPKVKQFLWRLAKIAYHGRQTSIEEEYRMDEDGGHCFLKCNYVKKCQRMMCLEHVRTSSPEATTSAHMMCMILEWEVNERLNIVALLWAWWDARNKTNAEEQHMTCGDVIHKATVMVTDMLTMGRNMPKQDTTLRNIWVRSLEDKLKVNCDGAFVQSEKIGGWGFVIRNHDGEGVLAGAGHLQDAHACLAALDAAAEHGISRVILETDSLSLVSGLQTAVFDEAANGVLLCGIRES